MADTAPAPLHYPIRTVARMTGLGIDTLRAWERRYEAVRPARDDRGRLYSDADVRRLTLLRDAVANGHAIGRIARLDDRSLAAAASAAARTPAVDRPARRGVLDTAGLLTALDRFDAPFLEAELGRAATLLGPRALLDEVLLPALRAVGTRWSRGDASVAHEHLLSAIVRNVLGALMRSYGRHTSRARVVFATPAGELHELGTLSAAALAASAGLAAVYVGPNLPAADLVQVARSIDTDAVVLGVTAGGPDQSAIDREVKAIAAGLPREVELWIGGPAAGRLERLLHARGRWLRDFDDLVAQLERIGGEF